jgi:hypothetical protein
MDKVYLHEKVWVIENFLTQEELDWFRPFIDDTNGWYITMRSPYKNIMNKFIGHDPVYDENGVMLFPAADAETETYDILQQHIFPRLESVLSKHYRPHQTLQSFKYMTDEEIEMNLDPSLEYLKPINFAMQPHEDATSPDPEDQMFNASFSLYLNDDFEGGELEFLDIPVKIKPKAGMLMVIEYGQGLTHRVNKITSGNSRHTLYGNSWNDAKNIPISTGDNC